MIPASGLHADPLHPLAGDAYWHHESNFIFPATLAGFARVGAPQDLDGSSTVVAYYARGAGDDRLVVVVDVFPIAADGRIARKDVYSTSATPRVLSTRPSDRIVSAS